MTVRFVGDLLVLAVVLLAGYVAGFRLGRQQRPYWSAPPADGYVVEVFSDGNLILWQSLEAEESARSIAESWRFPGYAVMLYGPDDRVKEVVSGGDLLEEWETVWPLEDQPPR